MVEVNSPVTSLTGSNLYSQNTTASAVLTGVYANLSAGDIFFKRVYSISILSGMSADELTLYNTADPTFSAYYRNDLSASINLSPWTYCYSILLSVNSALEGVSNSKTLTTAVQRQLMGEAEFVRAYCYFYLVNLYGDVPLVLTPNYTINATLSRTPKEIVLAQIVADLTNAESLLSPNYLDATLLASTTERVRPTSWAAKSLLARTYLYLKQWDSAGILSSQVINNSQYSLDTLNGVFLMNSSEAIWQLQPVNSGWNTEDARVFVLPSTGPSLDAINPVYLSSSLLESFEPGDQRLVNWVDSLSIGGTTYYYPYKYKSATFGSSVTEYLTVL